MKQPFIIFVAADPISTIVNLIPVAVDVYRNVKDLMNSAKDDLEGSNFNWSTYINSIYGFKISWPTQRWNMREMRSSTPFLYLPIIISSTFTTPVNVPNMYLPGQMQDTVPSVNVAVDLHGSVEIKTYVTNTIKQYSSMAKSVGGEFLEETFARKVEANNAIIAGRIIYPGKTRSLFVVKLTRFEGKVYSVNGGTIEGVPNFDIIIDDLKKIINTFSLVGRHK